MASLDKNVDFLCFTVAYFVSSHILKDESKLRHRRKINPGNRFVHCLCFHNLLSEDLHFIGIQRQVFLNNCPTCAV
jgi:hypothetical protein